MERWCSWMSSCSLSVFVLLKITSNGWMLLFLTHRAATFAIQGHPRMWPQRDRVGSTPCLYSGGFRLEYRDVGYSDWVFPWFSSVSSERYQCSTSDLTTIFSCHFLPHCSFTSHSVWHRQLLAASLNKSQISKINNISPLCYVWTVKASSSFAKLATFTNESNK